MRFSQHISILQVQHSSNLNFSSWLHLWLSICDYEPWDAKSIKYSLQAGAINATCGSQLTKLLEKISRSIVTTLDSNINQTPSSGGYLSILKNQCCASVVCRPAESGWQHSKTTAKPKPAKPCMGILKEKFLIFGHKRVIQHDWQRIVNNPRTFVASSNCWKWSIYSFISSHAWL